MLNNPQLQHLVSLLRYAVSGTIAVGIDVTLLLALLSLDTPQVIAVCLSALVATTIHYIISRYFVFRTYKRTFFAGLLYFYSIIGISLGCNIALYLALTYIFPGADAVMRILAVAVVGIMSFFANARYNFKTL